MNRKDLTTDISPESAKEETSTKTLHQSLKFSDRGRLSSRSDLVTLIVYDGSTCCRTIFLLAMSSVVWLSFFGEVYDMRTLTGLVTIITIRCIWKVAKNALMTLERPKTCIDILALHGADDLVDLTNITDGRTRSSGRTSRELVTQMDLRSTLQPISWPKTER